MMMPPAFQIPQPNHDATAAVPVAKVYISSYTDGSFVQSAEQTSRNHLCLQDCKMKQEASTRLAAQTGSAFTYYLSDRRHQSKRNKQSCVCV